MVNTDRGQEGTARPPASLGPLGPPAPAPTSASSPLTFPTLDDFIPPHLQRRSHHGQPASAPGPRPPVSQTPPSFSPPPPLVPPGPEGLRRVSEPDLTGAVPSTVSLPESPPHGCPERLLLAVKNPFLTEVLSSEGSVGCHCACVAMGTVFAFTGVHASRVCPGVSSPCSSLSCLECTSLLKNFVFPQRKPLWPFL